MRLHDKQLYDVIVNHFEASGISQTLREAAKYSFYSFFIFDLDL